MKTNWVLIAITATLALVLSINPVSYAFHENLGIDDNKASELYHSNPNDPAILQWKNALQSAINSMDEWFDISDYQKVIDCQSTISIINNNCKSHPNTLIGCNDSRLPQYPLILKKAVEAQQTAEGELLKEKALKLQSYGQDLIDKCFSTPNSNTTFEVTSPACDSALLLLQRDCQTASEQYNYCSDKRFVGYLTQHGIILKSTVSSYSNLTVNSSFSNSAYP